MLFVLMLSVALFFFGYFMNGGWRNALSLFSATWFVVFFVYFIEVFPYYELGFEVYVSIWMMLIGFFVGSYFASKVRGRGGAEVGGGVKDLIVYKKYASFLIVFCFVGYFSIYLYVATNSVQLVISPDFERLNTTYDGVDPFLREFIHKIGIPFLAVGLLFSSAMRARLKLFAVISSDVSRLRKRIEFELLAVSLACVVALVFYDLVSLKRMQTINVVVCIITAYYFVTPIIGRGVKGVMIYLSVFVVFMYLMSFVTEAREIDAGGGGVSSWILYFTGPLSYFNSFVSGFDGENYYGLSYLMGFVGFVLSPVLTLFGLPSVPAFYFDRQNTLAIGDGIQYNAFGTFMLDGYYDFGVVGVLVASIVTGFITTRWFRNARNTTDPLSLCFGAIGCSWVIFLPLGWSGGMQFALGQAPYSLLLLHLLSGGRLLGFFRKAI